MSAVLLILIGCAKTGLLIPGSLDHMHTPPPEGVVVVEPEEPPEAGPITPEQPELVEPLDPLDVALSRAPAPSERSVLQVQLVRSARALLDRRNIVVGGERLRHDCIGMVAAAYTMSGMDITHSISDLHAQAEAAGIAHTLKRPEPGDVVFFDNSYDKNGNGIRDDPFTHVTIVERVDAEGTITMIHLGGKDKPVSRRVMNLYHPDEKTDAAGNTINSTLRSVNGRDGGPELTSQLFRGFGSIWKLAEESDDSSGK